MRQRVPRESAKRHFDSALHFVQFGQQLVGIAGAGVGVVRVLDVEVVAVLLDLGGRDLPRLLARLAAFESAARVRLAPPLLLRSNSSMRIGLVLL